VGIDEGREYRFNLDRFQSPQLAGLFRSDAEMWRLLELLANKLDPVTYRRAPLEWVAVAIDKMASLAVCRRRLP
jgi:hypothetical protein